MNLGDRNEANERTNERAKSGFYSLRYSAARKEMAWIRCRTSQRDDNKWTKQKQLKWKQTEQQWMCARRTFLGRFSFYRLQWFTERWSGRAAIGSYMGITSNPENVQLFARYISALCLNNSTHIHAWTHSFLLLWATHLLRFVSTYLCVFNQYIELLWKINHRIVATVYLVCDNVCQYTGFQYNTITGCQQNEPSDLMVTSFESFAHKYRVLKLNAFHRNIHFGWVVVVVVIRFFGCSLLLLTTKICIR